MDGSKITNKQCPWINAAPIIERVRRLFKDNKKKLGKFIYTIQPVAILSQQNKRYILIFGTFIYKRFTVTAVSDLREVILT